MKCRLILKKWLAYTALTLCCVLAAAPAGAVTLVDIYGPGQNMVNLAMAAPLVAPSKPALTIGKALHNNIHENLAFLPFMRLTPQAAILGGSVLEAWQGPQLDFRRFQIAGADLLMTAYWPKSDNREGLVEIRLFETYSGKAVFNKSYAPVNMDNVPETANRICADIMESLTGSGDFFRSTLVFIKTSGPHKRDVWLSEPTGHHQRQITNIAGTAMSPSWSPDSRYIVFSHMDDSSHALGVWDRTTNKVRRIRFPGNTVIGPVFMPDNKVAVALSTSGYPDIYLLNHQFQRERVLEGSPSIDVSPSFDASGLKMAFVSGRMGGPQIFLKDFTTGMVRRVSMNGGYNTEPALSPDGTLVAFTRLTPQGHRIFVQDMLTGIERQVSFGPGRDEQPSFAPDSYFIAFTSNRMGQNQIFLTTRHGGEARHVPTGAGAATFPRWGKIPENIQQR